MDEEIKHWNAGRTSALLPIKLSGAVIGPMAAYDSRIRSSRSAPTTQVMGLKVAAHGLKRLPTRHTGEMQARNAKTVFSSVEADDAAIVLRRAQRRGGSERQGQQQPHLGQRMPFFCFSGVAHG